MLCREVRRQNKKWQQWAYNGRECKTKGVDKFSKKKTNSDDSAKQIVSVTMFFSKQVLHREHFFIPKLIELERSIEKLDVPMILVV